MASPAKLDRIRSYGAELVITGDRYADALEASQEWTERTGALPIHAYESVETLLGQGTLGLELEEQSPKLDSLLVAVGGGGLIGGVAAWYENRTQIVSVEPELAPTLNLGFRGRTSGRFSRGRHRCRFTGAAASRADDVSDRAEIRRRIGVGDRRPDTRSAEKALGNVRIVAEPGGAAAFAALFSGRLRPKQVKRVGVIVCGGNSDINFS